MNQDYVIPKKAISWGTIILGRSGVNSPSWNGLLRYYGILRVSAHNIIPYIRLVLKVLIVESHQ